MAPTAAAATRVASHLDAACRGTRGAIPTRDAACCSGSGPGPGRAQVFFPPRAPSSTRDPCGGRLQSGGFTHLETGKLPGTTGGVLAPRAVLDSARYRAEKEAQQQQQRRRQQQQQQGQQGAAAAAQDGAADDDDDEGTCPVDCVREVRSAADFHQVLADSKRDKALVVVDFYRTACGSCKYIERGFVKLCKGSGNDNASVLFLKHNVMDEYEEQSEIAASYKIRNVPLFHFYKDGELVEAFTTREKSKILAAICKHTGLVPAVAQAQAD